MEQNKYFNTKSEQNILSSFAGESMAFCKYYLFARQAKQEGYEQISECFLKIAENELAHAYIFLKEINGIGNTLFNLELAKDKESEEYHKIYREYQDIASKEGFDALTNKFKLIANVEKMHELKFLELSQNIIQETVFKKEEKVSWICRNCGHIHYGKDAPEKCQLCSHPQSYFEEHK
jgi:rubrerythrin